MVLDAQRQGIAGVTVVVAIPAYGLIVTAVTNASGAFVVNLPILPGLNLSIPALGVGGIDIDPGVPVVIVVP